MSTTSSDVKDITEEPEYKLRDAEEEAGLRPPASDAVKAAITYPQTGFPVNTPDGHVMATKEAKVVNAKGEEVPAVDHPNLTETHAVLKAGRRNRPGAVKRRPDGHGRRRHERGRRQEGRSSRVQDQQGLGVEQSSDS